MYNLYIEEENISGDDNMNFFRGRSDVAVEIAETNASRDFQGIKKTEFSNKGIDVTRIDILSDRASEILQKDKGRYITINLKNSFEDYSVFENAVETVFSEISSVIKDLIGKDDFSAIIVGLGNVDLTSDAIGPDTIKGILVTKHIRENLPQVYDSMRFNSVTAISPGVLGQTGIESSVIVKAVCGEVKPDIVILIDSLASHYPEKLCGTVQISDTGISPGSGVGNSREKLNFSTIGVPVMTIGVPTVVDTVTLTGNVIYQILEKLRDGTDKSELSIYDNLSSAWNESTADILKRKISETSLDFIVTPKDIDCLVKKVSHLLSISLNKALHNNISQEDINALLN